MTSAQVTKALQGYFVLKFNSCEVEYAQDLPHNIKREVQWVRVTVKTGRGSILEKGEDEPLTRIPGIMIVDVFTPLKFGGMRGLDVADTIQSLFRVKDINGIYTEQPYIDDLGASEFAFMHSVCVPFHFYQGS